MVAILRQSFQRRGLINVNPAQKPATLSVVRACLCCEGRVYLVLMHFLPQILQPPSAIITIIAATRMHRSLTDFAHGPTTLYGIL